MNVGGCRHIYEGFYEKSIYQMTINRERTTTIEGAFSSLVGILSFWSFYLLVKRFEKKIQPSKDRLDTVRG